MPPNLINSDLVEIAVEDGGGEGTEQAEEVAEAEPGSKQAVVTLRVGSRADTHITGCPKKSALFHFQRTISKFWKQLLKYERTVFESLGFHLSTRNFPLRP